MHKYHKPFGDYTAIKASFYDLDANVRNVDQLRRADELYVEQPRRTGCKLCETPLGEVVFTRQGVDYYLCSNCGQLNGAHEDTRLYCAALYVDTEDGPKGESVYADADHDAFMHRMRTIYRPKADFLIEELKKAGEDPFALSYVDFGAGAGHFVAAMLDAGLERVRGYDVSKRDVESGNAMIGREVVQLIRLDDFIEIASTVDADVATAIFMMEHSEDPVGLCAALARNPGVRYFLNAVPVFSPASVMQVAFPGVMPRVMGQGHTHMFSEKSLAWLYDKFDFEVLTHWWFGSDAFDLHRSIDVQLRLDPKTAGLAKIWGDMVVPALDKLQLAFDEQKRSSEVHSFLRIKRA